MPNYKKLALDARRRVLSMVFHAQTSHIASNFSCIDFATVLYENLQEGDEVVWSKGWAAATIYYFLAKQGKIPEADLERFPQEPYFGLAETTVPGVHVSGGSMGHGLPVAVGMALGKKRAGEPGVIYCIMSDGEMNEGTTWESAGIAAHQKLDNLVVLVDQNGWQAMGRTTDIMDIRTRSVFSKFGWWAKEYEGHHYEEIEESLKDQLKKLLPVPKVNIYKTTKGKGVSFFEDHLLYHYKNVDDGEYKKALAELV